MNIKEIKQREGILVRCIGGPLDGCILRVPSLDDSFSIHPEDNFGKSRGPAATIIQNHRYDLRSRITVDGVPTYRYGGTDNGASNS